MSSYDGLQQYSLSSLGGGLHALTRMITARSLQTLQQVRCRKRPREKSPLQGDTSGDGGRLENRFSGRLHARGSCGEARTSRPTSSWRSTLANASYLASNANVQLRLVGTMLSSGYSEAGKSYTDLLYNIRDGAGALSAVHVQRNALGADLVGFFRQSPELLRTCICEFFETAMPIPSQLMSACRATRFAHELWPQLRRFDNDIANPAAIPRHTSMAMATSIPGSLADDPILMLHPAATCPRIGNFSNPSVNHNGHPTGTVTQHDVARVHRERAAVIAAFRATSSPKAVMSTPAPGLDDHDHFGDLQLDCGFGRWRATGFMSAMQVRARPNIFSGGGAQTSRTGDGPAGVGHAERSDLMSYYRLGLTGQRLHPTRLSGRGEGVMTSPTPARR